MKATIKSQKFVPAKLTITFESQAELDAMGTLFNTAPINEALCKIGGKPISYELFVKAGANIDKVDKLLAAVKGTYHFSDWKRNY